MKIYCIIFLLIVASSVSAQKKSIEYSSYGSWPVISSPKISDNGKYVMYDLRNGNGNILVIKSINSTYHQTIYGSFVREAEFIEACNIVVYKNRDTLTVLNLLTGETTHTHNVSSFKVFKKVDMPFLVYLVSLNGTSTLMIMDTSTGKQKSIPEVSGFYSSKDGQIIVTEKTIKEGHLEKRRLSWLFTKKINPKLIWEGTGYPMGLCFNEETNQISFIIQMKKGPETNNSVYHYKYGMEKADLLIDDQILADRTSVVNNAPPRISKDGKRIFFEIKHKKDISPISSGDVDVDVWNYRDKFLQSQQLIEESYFKENRSFQAVYNFASKRIIQLSKENEAIYAVNDNYALVTRNPDGNEYWREDNIPSAFIVSTQDGSETLLGKGIRSALFSPTGRFVLYFDQKANNYYCFDVVTKNVRNITGMIKVPLCDENSGLGTGPLPFGHSGWLKDDKALFLYDRYDIWQVDPLCKNTPINITKGIGRINNTVFRILDEKSLSFLSVYPNNNHLKLVAFNSLDKSNGFYDLKLQYGSTPRLLTMGPYIYYYHPLFFLDEVLYSSLASSLKPIKAAMKKIYVVLRMSATDYPNLFVTRNFKDFKPLTDIKPQKEYNWLKSELVHWPVDSQSRGSGILYKPENFYPEKKYPLVFYVYGKNANSLNFFNFPKWSSGPMNIPEYVSKGYMVFVPDISIGEAQTTNNILKTIVSASEYFKRISYIDSLRIGIQGHSFGAYETNLVITKTNNFAAAVAAAGVSNLISHYGDIEGEFGKGAIQKIERGQYAMNHMLWDDLNSYMESSPILFADKVKTPLLLMSNKNDGPVPWKQGLQFFLLLRRLNKPSWLLQYNNGGHTVSGNDSKDYTIRLSQFFDHYLKGAPAPLWMVDGVSAKDKGRKTGLELDTLGRTPGPGLLTPEERKKIDGYTKIPLEQKLRNMVEK